MLAWIARAVPGLRPPAVAGESDPSAVDPAMVPGSVLALAEAPAPAQAAAAAAQVSSRGILMQE